MSKMRIIPIFVPHKGCPNQCTFCNQRHITGQIEEMTPYKAEEIVKTYLKTIDTNKYYTMAAFYGGSFTATPIEYQTELLKVVYKYVESGDLKGIRLSTRPDAINEEILDNLKKYGVLEIELGVQSMCEDVLLKNKRGHDTECVKKSSKMIKDYGFTLGLQMMTGLFGDTDEKSIYTAKEIAKLKPAFVRIYPTLVFKNTDLCDYYEKGEYTPETVEEAVSLCRKLVKIFDENNIKVIRLGLLMEETARENFVAGPYHDRFRELI